METKTWCAYNVTRGCTLSPKVTVADSEREPLKVLKVMIEGLARDSESSLWLTPLLYAPQLTRLFPFDLVYLDGDQRVIHGAALVPGVQIPQFTDNTASALILPLETLTSTKTQPGDRLEICAAEELESRLAEVSTPVAVASVAPGASSPVSLAGTPDLPPLPFPAPQIFNPTRTSPVQQGSGFTFALTTGWQITNSTVATAMPDIAENAAQTSSAEERLVIVAADTSNADAAKVEAPVANVDARPPAPVDRIEEVRESPSISEVSVESAPTPVMELAAVWVEEAENQADPTSPAACESSASAESSEVGKVPASKTSMESASGLVTENIKIDERVPEISALQAKGRRETPEKKSGAKKKDALTTRFLRWLNLADLPERRAYPRLVSPGLVAYDTNKAEANPLEVGDVSPTGLYLRTGDRWRPGELILLTLAKKSASEVEPHSRVAVHAGAVRCGEDGVGLSFVFPGDVEFHPWNRVHTKRATETDGEYFVRELRIANAVGFLRRICPPASEEIRELLYERHSNKRVANSVAIALKAEDLVTRSGGARSTVAHPDVVMRILEAGSWAEDDWIQQFWAGLLMTSCTMDGQDKSNLVYVDMLDKLTPIHLRILSAACKKGWEVVSSGDSTSKLTLYFTADELIAAAGTHSLSRIQQTIKHLSNFGLLAESARPSYIAATEKKINTKTTPTSLGLEMYARCNGRR